MEEQIKARAFEIIEAITAERDRALNSAQALSNFITQLAHKLGVANSDEIMSKVEELLDDNRDNDE